MTTDLTKKTEDCCFDVENLHEKMEKIGIDWSRYFLSEAFFQGNIKYTDDVATNYLVEVIRYMKDTNRSVIEFMKLCINSSKTSLHMKILLQTGFLQCLYVQQDLILEVLEIFKLQSCNSEDWKYIRDLRNKLVGHPVCRSKDKEKALRSTVLWTNNKDINIISFIEYPKGQFSEKIFNEENVSNLLSKHYQYMSKYLNDVLNKMATIKEDYGNIIHNFLRMNDEILESRVDCLKTTYLTSLDSLSRIIQYEYLEYAILKNKETDDEKYRLYIDTCIKFIKNILQERYGNISGKDIQPENNEGDVPDQAKYSMRKLAEMRDNCRVYFNCLRCMFKKSTEIVKVLNDLENYLQEKNKPEYYVSYVLLKQGLINLNSSSKCI